MGIGGALFSLVLVDYLGREYSPFVTRGSIENVLVPSGIRLACRLGYVVGLVAMWRAQRWGVVLVLVSWLGQSIPNAIVNPSGDSALALVLHRLDLVVFLFVVWIYRRVFSPGPVLRPIAAYLIVIAVLHPGLVVALRALNP